MEPFEEQQKTSTEEPVVQDVKQKQSKKPANWRVWLATVVLASVVSGGSGAFVSWQLLSTQKTTTSTTTIVKTTANTTASDGVTEVVEKTAPSVVEVYATSYGRDMFGRQASSQSSGSGVIVSEDGYIITNHHVIDGASEVTVRLNDGTEYTAQVITSDEDQDLAILKVTASGLTPVTFADSDQIEVGETAVAIGNPLGVLGGTVTEGIVSAKDREIEIDGVTMDLIQTSAAVNSGNSGGGLFDSDGALIGIVNAKSSGTSVEGLAFAIPANTVKTYLQNNTDVIIQNL